MIEHTKFKYCPFCGGRDLSRRDVKAMQCESCRGVYYHNAAAAVAAIIECDDKIILTKRAHEPFQGLLDLPGGFSDYNESLEEALRREVQEELSVEIVEMNYYCSAPNKYYYNNVYYFSNDAFFICQIDSVAEIKVNDDVSDFLIVKPGRTELEKFAFDSIRKVVEQYLNA